MADNNVPNQGKSPPPQGNQYENQAPTAPQAPPQYRQYQQPLYAAPAPPKTSAFEGIVRPSTLAVLVFVGILIVMVGMIILSATNLMTSSSREDIMNTMGVGYILVDVGMSIVASFLLVAGIVQKESGKYTRMALLIAGTLTLLAWLSLGPGL